MKHFISISFLVLFSFHSFAQTDTLKFFEPSPKYNKKRFSTIVIAESVGYAATMIGLNQLWYKNYPRSSFHFFNDNDEWLQMDKAGHALTSYYIGKAGREALKWSGVANKKSIIYGGALGSMFLTTVEIFDGFSSQWGFSYGDFLSNSFGTLLFIGQELTWQEQRLLLKFSVHTTNYANYRPDLLGSTYSERILKDYNGHTYWLSANIASFLKEDTRFPHWFNIALGYSAEGMIGGDKNPLINEKGIPYPTFKRARKYYLSFDIDLTRIKTRYPLTNTLLGAFGFIKIPAPTIEYSNNLFSFKPFYF